MSLWYNLLFQSLLRKTIEAAQKAYNSGCKQIDDKNLHKSSCVKQFQKDVYGIRKKVNSQLNSLLRYYGMFDPEVSYSNDKLINRLFGPFKSELDRIMNESYVNCDFKIINMYVHWKFYFFFLNKFLIIKIIGFLNQFIYLYINRKFNWTSNSNCIYS